MTEAKDLSGADTIAACPLGTTLPDVLRHKNSFALAEPVCRQHVNDHEYDVIAIWETHGPQAMSNVVKFSLYALIFCRALVGHWTHDRLIG